MNVLTKIVREDGEIKIANLVTLSRGLLILPILLLLLRGFNTAALGVYLLASATDMADGRLARANGRASPFGAQLDAIVDNIFSLAILLFIVLAFPGLEERHGVALAILFGGPILYLAVSYLLAGRVLMFHFWSAKAGAALLFALWPLLYLTAWEGFVTVAAAVVGFSRLEQVMFILRGGADEDAPHMFKSTGR